MNSTKQRQVQRLKRKKRIRKNMTGTPTRPRMSVFRSAKHIYTQIVDDTQGITLVAASTTEKEVREQQKFENKTAAAMFIGQLVAQRAAEKGIKSVVFDRNGFLYHGRVKAVTDGARKAGLDF
jgi:large subunit ribosomal protein L18